MCSSDHATMNTVLCSASNIKRLIFNLDFCGHPTVFFNDLETYCKRKSLKWIGFEIERDPQRFFESMLNFNKIHPVYYLRCYLVNQKLMPLFLQLKNLVHFDVWLRFRPTMPINQMLNNLAKELKEFRNLEKIKLKCSFGVDQLKDIGLKFVREMPKLNQLILELPECNSNVNDLIELNSARLNLIDATPIKIKVITNDYYQPDFTIPANQIVYVTFMKWKDWIIREERKGWSQWKLFQ